MTARFWSLRRKMLALLIIASTLPLIIDAFILTWRGRQLLYHDAQARLGALGDDAATRIDLLHERYIGVVDGVARLPDVRTACSAIASGQPAATEARDTLEAMLRGDEMVRSYALLDPKGVIRVTTEPAYQDVDLSARRYVQRARRDGQAIDLVLTTRLAQDIPVIVYARQVDQCMMLVVVRAEALARRIRGVGGGVGEGGFVVVFDELGIKIAHGTRPDFEYTPSGPIPDDERAAMIAERRFGRRTEELLDHVIAVPRLFELARAPTLGKEAAPFEVWVPANRTTNLAVARRLSSAPWTAVVLVPKDSVDAPVGALLWTSAPTSLAVLLIAFVIGFVIMRRILRPVRSLTEASAAIASGQADARVTISTKDELGELGENFNAMADAIEKGREELERKVKDRTQALMIVNEELRAHREELLAHRTELVAQKDELQTQRDELQRKNEEVERADRMKSEFLANMSHELRTPLNSVIGFADLLQVTASDRLSADETSQLGDIVSAGRHLLMIINDILDLAKIEAGHVRLQLDAIDPDEVVTAAVSMVQAQARQKRIEVRTSVRSRRAIRADGGRMRQVLLNLLSNAIKFSPDGASVDVRVSDADGDVLVEVVDRGPGIPAETAARLFQPFVQGEGALIKKHQGTGLGLAISKKLVELHGGRIELTSKVGEGSTFSVYVPAAGRRTRATPPSDASTVLLVVDNPEHGHRARLEAAGYRVAGVDLGEDLGAAATKAGAAAVVVDLADVQGDTSGVLARANELSATLPVILLSQEAEVLVPKPIDAAPLRALCRRLTGAGGRPRVLVIDDDPRVPELVSAALGRDYRVEGVGTATDGLARARAERFDLHVVDLSLPDGSGFDVLEQLAADAATSPTPRIVLTAAKLEPAQLEQLRRHADAVAPKGAVTPEELLGVVDRLVRAPLLEVAADAPHRPAILVVDDHDMNRDLARSILERLGYAVLQARDGAEAVAIADRERPNLILMDLAMPGTDGFTATRQLKAHPQLRRIPVVALTAMAMQSDEDRARAAGVDAFLTKPLDRVALERTVAQMLADEPAREVAR
jgi:signal transduction histidine kinase/CheY-like chemotaxis protein